MALIRLLASDKTSIAFETWLGSAALLSVASGEAKGSGYDFYMRASEGKQLKGETY